MSRMHGWKPRPKFTAGLNVAQEEWDRIFGKKEFPAVPVKAESEGGEAREIQPNDLLKLADSRGGGESLLTNPHEKSNAIS